MKRPAKITFETVHEDNHLILTIKPFNVPTQADSSGDPDMLNCVKKYLKKKYNKPGNVYLGMIHRLDRPVGGLLLFAKTSKAASRLSDQIRRREFYKEYVAAVTGVLNAEKGQFVHHLIKDKAKRRTRAYNNPKPDSKRAELKFETLGASSGLSLVKIIPATGRPHQIRAQFSAMGHPVIGDLKYGAKSPAPYGNILLYATRLDFAHPVTKEILSFEIPHPADWPL